MKIIYTLLVVVFTFNLNAQDAPDFTVTDVHGKTHSLYADYLDKGKTVVLDIFYADCGPCNQFAPLLETVYQAWGAGEKDVEFISITGDEYGVDDNDYVKAFEERNGISWPGVSNEGGGPEAAQPYLNNMFGLFIGYPTVVVIGPDKSVQFDPWAATHTQTLNNINTWIENTGAMKGTSSNEEVLLAEGVSIFPNPTTDMITIAADLNVESYDIVNVVGQTVLTNTAQSNNIDVSGLDNGQYFLRIKTTDNLIVNKAFTKQ